MQLSNDGKLYNIFEEKLVEISERVGYGSEEVSSEKHRVFEEAWEFFLRDLGVFRTIKFEAAFSGPHSWHPSFVLGGPTLKEKDGFFVVADPLYTTGKDLEIPRELALKILTLGGLP